MQDAAASSFTLRIVFTGLCLLVEDYVREDGRKLVHVLLPHTGSHYHPGGTHQHSGGKETTTHHAYLIYNGEYEGGTGMQKRLFTYKLIDLTGVLRGGSPSVDPTGIVNLTEELNARVPRHLLGEETSEKPISRVTFDSGRTCDGEGCNRGEGALWKFGNKPHQRMTTWFEWVIEGIKGEGMELQVQALDGTGTDKYPLKPIADAGGGVEKEIRLFVFHTLPGDIPKNNNDLRMPLRERPPPNSGPAKHFNAYYSLLSGQPTEPPVPIEYKLPPGVRPEVAPFKIWGLDYSCMVAMAEAQPWSVAGPESTREP